MNTVTFRIFIMGPSQPTVIHNVNIKFFLLFKWNGENRCWSLLELNLNSPRAWFDNYLTLTH